MKHPASFLLGILLFSVHASSAYAFFQIFTQLADDIKKIEQSADGAPKAAEQLQTVTFTDVGKNDWFTRYVAPVAKWGIVSGYRTAEGKPTGTFGPGNTVTIAEVMKMSMKAAQVDETTCKGDTGWPQAEQHWARPFVICARERNVRLISAKPDLNRSATRAEVLSAIFDAFGDTVPPLYATFTDAANHRLEPDIAYGAALNIVSGDKDKNGNHTGTFRPDAAVNRAEAAKMIYERLRVEVMERQD